MTNNILTVTDSDFYTDVTVTAESITNAYRSADRATKSAMRTAVAAAMVPAVATGDIAIVSHVMALSAAMVPAKSASTATRPDYVAQVRNTYATLSAAIAALQSGDFTLPDAVVLTDSERDALSDLSGGTVDSERVAKLATIGGRKANRGAVAGYVSNVFGATDADTLTVAELRAAWSPEVGGTDYPSAAPSAGAVSAMLNRDNGETDFGFVATHTDDGTLAATRV